MRIHGDYTLITIYDGDCSIVNTEDGEYGSFQEIERGEKYTGAVEVTPKAYDDIVLPTKDKIVFDDITIYKIKTYEVHNESGTTFYIAEEGV